MDIQWTKLRYNDIYDDRYEVSNMGRVRRVGSTTLRKLHTDRKGYQSFQIRFNNRLVFCYVHRAVLCSFNGIDSNKTQVNHKDFDPQNNRLDNLEWVSYAQNNAYSVNKGRHLHRIRKLHKLTDAQVLND